MALGSVAERDDMIDQGVGTEYITKISVNKEERAAV